MRENGRNNNGDADWQAGSYSYIIQCSSGDQLRWKVTNVYTSSNLNGAGAMLDGYNHFNGGKNTANTNFLIGRSWSKEDLQGMAGYIAWVASWKKMLTEADASEIWHHTRKFFSR